VIGSEASEQREEAVAGRFDDSVRASSATLSLRELLQQPATELLGVDADAATALKAVGIETIFDLGSSMLFAEASAALAAAASNIDLVTGDLLSTAATPVAADDVPGLPLARLKSLSNAQATALGNALAVTSVRELALWPPRVLAHQLVSAAAGTDLATATDEGAEELRPRLGEYPTERVYYDTLVMLGTTDPGNQTPLTKPLSLADLTSGNLLFGKPAVGAVATYAQSWFAQGVTLGHMLHSLALAPGEATRIAVIDWARRTSATASESIAESQQLDSAENHARAVSEVQNAVANEMQKGGSIATGWSKSTSNGSAFGASFGSGIAGVVDGIAGVVGFGGGGGSSSSDSETNSNATSASWSVGSRSVMSEMNQRVNDRTEQHSTSVRNRRATAVREVSQSEHEQVSTRIVANYNHMHALTVQYYEVVQIYRVTVQLHKFVRALFLPFALMDFSAPNGQDLVTRFRGELLAAALTSRAAELLLDEEGRIQVKSAVRVPRPISIAGLADAVSAKPMVAMMAAAPDASASPAASAGLNEAVTTGTVAAADGTSHPIMTAPGPVLTGPTIRFLVTRPGPIAEIVPGGATLASIGFEGVTIDNVRVNQAGAPAGTTMYPVDAASAQVDFPTAFPLSTVDSIDVARNGSSQPDGSMILTYESDGHRSMAVVPLSLADGTAMQKAAFLSGDGADRQAELLAHLQGNRSYYTRAVLQSLDAASLVLLLSGVSWNGKPLADQVEPRPVAIAGNFLVLRAPAEDGDASGVAPNQTWKDLLEERQIDLAQQDARLVPIPSGGVFAEAVLGRSNSAEKLDITRFWNWQDSPIPLAPPEIAAVATGSRAQPENLMPGQLGAPVINVMPPTALPEPTGLTAALGALANGSMFRDMSGLAGTQAAAQAASAGTLSAATEAAKIASDNYKTASTQATQMGQEAADLWKVWKQSESKKSDGSGSGSGSAGSGGPGSAGISGDGARINLGRDLDQRGVSTQASGSQKSLSDMLKAAGLPSGDGSSGSSSGAGGSSSTDYMPGAPTSLSEMLAAGGGSSGGSFSRELSAADEATAYSPAYLGATADALRSGIVPASFSIEDGFGSNSPFNLFGTPEQIFLRMLRADVIGTGNVSLTNVRLLPMRLHRNHVEFENPPVAYLAWTNSSTDIYVNVPLFFELYNNDPIKTTNPDQALGNMRATGVISIRHEAQHTDQFRTNGNKPPANFKAMVKFEDLAYNDTDTWITNNMAYLTGTLKADPAVVNKLKADMLAEATNDWDTWLSKSSAEAFVLMKDGDYLPKALGNHMIGSYAITDLYDTPAVP
jgi:hypothetical protein